jgi:hypothetical protein
MRKIRRRSSSRKQYVDDSVLMIREQVREVRSLKDLRLPGYCVDSRNDQARRGLPELLLAEDLC